jgi:hypothetical protein
VRGKTGTDGGGVGIYIRNSLRYKIVRQSTETGVEFLFVEIRLFNRVILVGLSRAGLGGLWFGCIRGCLF